MRVASRTFGSDIASSRRGSLRGVKRRLPLHLAMVAVLASAVPVVFSEPSPVDAAPPSRAAKVTICHRTRSTTNPYRRITVSKNSAKTSSGTGHAGHTGAPWVTTNTNGQVWGDIIPDVDTNGTILNPNPALNYTGDNKATAGERSRGVAIYGGTTDGGVDYAGKCGAMTSKEFIRVHVDSGGSLSAAMTELDSMAAAEDDSLKQAIGSTFASWYVSLGSPT
ncbi:MAG: hypothetical protein ACO35F_10175, partial [Ilumatobacteraceae bacterium]